ncbi:MAG: hypothetical protein ABR954_02815 [Dehalococcoidales bacterium]
MKTQQVLSVLAAIRRLFSREIQKNLPFLDIIKLIFEKTSPSTGHLQKLKLKNAAPVQLIDVVSIVP